jgi:hypothetical protein
MAGLNRIGAGIGMSFDELRNKAAGTGISLASVTKLIEKSGVTIAVLGDNTTEGSIRLLDMVSSLRSASREAGFFGLQSGELATLLVDEIELRRQIYSDEQLSMMLQRGLNQTLREVIINETAMARLTGQNVHERMLARQNFAADPSNAAALAMLEEGQREVANTAIQALGTFGPAMTDMMNKALANALMGRPTTMGNEHYAQVMPILEQMGINVEGMMSQLVQQVRSGNNDVAAVNESVFRITSSLTNLAEGDMEILRDLAVGGNQAAGTILQGRMQALAPEIDAVTGRFVGLENTIERTALAFDNGELKLQGMFGNVEEATQNFKQGIVNMLLGIAGIGTGPDEQGLRDRVTSIVDNYLALSESFRSGTDDPMALLQGLLTALSPSIPNLLSKPNQPPPASSDDIKTHFGPGSAMSTTLNTVAAATAQNTSVLERLISMLGRTGQ